MEIEAKRHFSLSFDFANLVGMRFDRTVAKRRSSMLIRLICSALLVAGAFLFSPTGTAQATDDGIVRVKSAYDMPETLKRLKKDVADKGIVFFSEIDQAKLAADAGVTLLPSTLLVFGNPPLGTLFITSDADAGLDWPVSSSTRRIRARSGWPTRTSPGLRAVTASPTATRNSRWLRR
jgi:Domain of unknown function DUF302